jgi:hypothetical protein
LNGEHETDFTDEAPKKLQRAHWLQSLAVDGPQPITPHHTRQFCEWNAKEPHAWRKNLSKATETLWRIELGRHI